MLAYERANLEQHREFRAAPLAVDDGDERSPILRKQSRAMQRRAKQPRARQPRAKQRQTAAAAAGAPPRRHPAKRAKPTGALEPTGVCEGSRTPPPPLPLCQPHAAYLAHMNLCNQLCHVVLVIQSLL